MKGKKFYYDSKADVLYLLVKKGTEEEVVEVSPGINVELDRNGKLLGIEILNASESLGKIINGKPASLESQHAFSSV